MTDETSADGLRDKLARYHEHVDAMFWGWNRIWLAPEFRAWNIEEYLPRIACPLALWRIAWFIEIKHSFPPSCSS